MTQKDIRNLARNSPLKMIQPATLDDWPEIERIYRAGIRTGLATFETEADVPDGRVWFAGKIAGMVFKQVVADGRILGWCALSPVSKRRVYAGVAEVSVYVAADAWGQGVGTALLTRLIRVSEAAGIWTLQAGIFPENGTSLRLHQKLGFRVVGRREKLAQLDGVWRDVLLLERRTAVSL